MGNKRGKKSAQQLTSGSENFHRPSGAGGAGGAGGAAGAVAAGVKFLTGTFLCVAASISGGSLNAAS